MILQKNQIQMVIIRLTIAYTTMKIANLLTFLQSLSFSNESIPFAIIAKNKRVNTTKHVNQILK